MLIRTVRLTLLVLILLNFPGRVTGQEEVDRAIAFVGVTVVPMDVERTIESQTVVIQGGRITIIGPADSVELPPDTVSIDAAGKFLMPGLADMHVHVFSEDELPLYVANGVTTIRNMWGWSLHLELRDRVGRGELLGPQIYTAGALIDGDPPRLRGSAVAASAEQAEQVVARQIRQGYDFIKVYDGLSPEAYGAVLMAARAGGFPVVGHVPERVGLPLVLAGGQKGLEHLWGVPAALSASSEKADWSSDLDPVRMTHLARAMRRSGVWNTPTLVVLAGQEMTAAETTRFLARPELKYLPPFLKRFCCSGASDPEDDLAEDIRRKRSSNRKRMIEALHREGAGILLGTDTGNPFILPGFSIHEELALLVDAGLTPYEAIASGTRLAAEFMGDSDLWGTVEVGKQADLLLLDSNPLQGVAAITHPEGVSLQGKWLSAHDLAVILERLAAKHSP